MTDATLRTPLYQNHLRAGGRMVSFAGWDMPVQYDSVIAESKAVRDSAGMFDVSHMARLSFKGPQAQEYLEHITSNDISKLPSGAGQYSLLPNFQGGCVDDIIVYKIEENLFRMVVNAANHHKDVEWMRAQNKHGVVFTDQTHGTAMIAVQGPSATDILAGLSDNPEALRGAPMFGVVNCKIAGADCFSVRSGYTGEDGFELICPSEQAPALWESLVAAGVEPCGLGARDVLRVEAGLPLYGHELNDDLSPIAAGLGWVISKTKNFIGSEIINAARVNGTPKKLQGVKLNSKRLIAPGMKVYVDDKEVGEVSSGVFSPMLNCGIAFAFIDSAISLDTPASIDVRGKLEPGAVVSKRFFKRSK